MIADSVPPVAAVALAIVAFAVFLAIVSSLTEIVQRLFAAPGVAVHEFAHEQVCHLVGVPVTDVAYFRFGDPPGYVEHGQPSRYRESFAISVAPFLVNTVVALGVFVGFAALVSSLGLIDAVLGSDGVLETVGAVRDVLESASVTTLGLAVLSGWLGFSIGMQAFPSTGDARTLWSRSRAEWRRSPVVLLGIPVVVVIYFVNLLSWLWADVLYALALAIAAFYAVGLV